MFRNCLITLLTIFTAAFSAAGQESAVRSELYKATLHYGFDKGAVDLGYRDNRQSLEDLRNAIETIGESNIDSLEITSYSSPQGVYEHNMLLARKRLASVEAYFRCNYPESLQQKMVFRSGGESWDMLRSSIEGDSQLTDAQKAQAFKVIDADVNPGTKKWRMEQLPFYKYLLSSHYAYIRNACAVVVKYHTTEPEPEPEPVVEPEQVVTAPEPAPAAEPQPTVEAPRTEVAPAVEPVRTAEPVKASITRNPKARMPFTMAVKSNLLYDLATIPSIGAEVALGHHLTLAANYQGSWWKNTKKDFFNQSYGGDVELRWWLKAPFTGHHAGLYGQIQTFDFELGGKGLQMPDPAFGGGIEYGYSLPIARNFNLDFEVGVGYFTGTTLEYEPHDGHYVWQQTNRLRWFGPTKLGVTLIWTPFNSRKGGRR